MQEIFSFIQHHWYLGSALIGVLILLILLEFLKQNKGSVGLSPARATQLINREDAMIVDLRTTEAYASGHIVDALSLPANELETKFKKIEKLKSKPVILVCAQGGDSLKKYAFLQKSGFTVYILGGGMRAWKEAGMPTVKT